MAVIQIEQLTVTEKIQFMESLWDSLCAHPEDVSSPAWHGEALQEREVSVQSQTDDFMDWEEVKQVIRKQLL
jgi:putative addiction module component (TIGR02574 family)